MGELVNLWFHYALKDFSQALNVYQINLQHKLT